MLVSDHTTVLSWMWSLKFIIKQTTHMVRVIFRDLYKKTYTVCCFIPNQIKTWNIKTTHLCHLFTSVCVNFPEYRLLKAVSVNVLKQLSASFFPVMHNPLGRRSYCLLYSQKCEARLIYWCGKASKYSALMGLNWADGVHHD